MNKEKNILKVTTRKRIYDVIKKYAGIHPREIERITGLATGSVHHHIHYLKKYDLIKEEKVGNNLRYFPNEINQGNKKLLSLLRQKNLRKILLFILNKKTCTQKDIIIFMNRSPSTISWYMKRLVQERMLSSKKQGKEIVYKIMVDHHTIMNLLITYQESFLDKLVDQTIEMWT
jgi:predicted transcriptional regulator